jgi:hypothetical protein
MFPSFRLFKPASSVTCAVLAVSLLTGGGGSLGAQAQTAKRYTVPALASSMSPAVVFIGNIDESGKVTSIGSGFVVDPNGLIVTNYHVIHGARALQIKMKDGEIYDRVDVVDFDVRRDLAVLKIRAFKSLPSAKLGDSGRLEVGEDVVAIGNPKGLEHTVSAGMISAFRQAEGYRLLQISVPISPGSSGGPLFNMSGEVVGITSAGVVAEGAQNLNFAVPIDYVRPLLTTTTSMSVAEFAKKMSATTTSGTTRSQSSKPAASELRAAWRVAHDHGETFKTFCLGTLYLMSDKIGYRNDSGIHNWEAPVSAVAEAAKNSVYGSNINAFHIRLVTKTNYNLVALNDQLQYVAPDTILIAIVQAMGK